MALNLGSITGTLELEDKFSKQLEESTKSALANMGNLGSAITGIAAGFVIAEKVIGAFTSAIGGTVEAITQLASKAEQLQNKSLSTGLTTGAIQGLQRLSENAGLSADALVFATSRMQRALAGTGEAFKKIGLNSKELLGQGTEEQLKAVAEQIMAIENPAQRTAAAMEIFGRSGRELIPVLKELAEGNEALKISLSEDQIANLAELDDAIDDLTGVWSDLGDQFLATLASSPEIIEALKSITEVVVSLVEPVGILASGFGMLAGKISDVAKAPGNLAQVLGLMELQIEKVSTATDKLSKSFQNIKPPQLDIPGAEEALKIMNTDDLKKGLGSVDDQVKKINESLKKQKDIAKDLLDADVERAKILDETDKAFREASLDTIQMRADAEVKRILATLEEHKKLLAVEVERTRIEEETNAALKEAAKLTAEINKQMSFGNILKESFKDLPNVILSAIQGGGDVGKAIGTKLGGDIMSGLFQEGSKGMKFLTDKLGDSLGGLVGSFAGPLGSMIGSIAGKGIDFLVSKFNIGGNKVIMQVNDMRDAFFDAQGGFVELQKKLVGLTDQDLVKKIFDAKTVEEFNAAVNEVNSLLNTQEMAQENLNAAIERYGFTLEELPMKMKQDEVNANFAQILQDFELLKAAGFDVNTILEKMGPNTSEFVNQAVAAGATIPEALRPVIEQMIASGQLLDENGKAYESVEDAGITFAQTMDEKFTTLIDKITQMVNALLGIPTDINTNVNIHTTRTESGGGGSDQSGDSPMDFPGRHHAEGGIVTTPTVSALAERGPEAIIPLDELSGMQGMGGPTTAELSPQSARAIARSVRDALLQAQ